MRKPKLIALDIETFYSKDYSLTKLTTEAYIRDPQFQIIGVSTKVNGGPATWHSFATLQEYRDLLSPLLEGNCLLCHNTAFDGAILGWRLGIHPPFLFDTLSMARPANQMTVGVSLKALAEKYTVGQKGTEVMLALGKRREDFTPEELYRYGEYCKNDVDLTYLLFHIMKQGFPPAELRVIDLLLKMYTDPVLELDVPVLQEHLSQVQAKKAEALATVEALCSKADIMSNNKFADILRGLGVDPPMKTSLTTGKPAYAFSKTDVGFKELLEHENPDVQAVVAARLGVKSTIEETRTLSFLGVAKRGPLPIMLNYYGAHTGRASGGDGMNLQNLPRGGQLRRSMVPLPGHVLVACDSAQIEARVVAWLADETELITAFANGEDVYSKFATKVYGREVTKHNDPVARHVGKTAVLGLGYSMGGEKFRLTLKTSKPSVVMESNEAQAVVNTYRSTYPRIKKLWDRGADALMAVLKGNNYVFGAGGLLATSSEGVHLPNGMIVRYPHLTMVNGELVYTSDRRQIAAWTTMNLTDEWDTNKLTRIYGGKCIENIVQALARIIVFDQMVVISKRYKVSHTVHDEVVTCVPEEEAEEAKAFMLAAMSVAPDWAPGLPIACEAAIGKNYADAK